MIKRESLPEWQALQRHQKQMATCHMRDLFISDQNRFERYSLEATNIFLDYSKNIITDETLSLLFQLAEACDLKNKINHLFSGKIVNDSEHRPALHMQLRSPGNQSFLLNGTNVIDEIMAVRKQMRLLAQSIANHQFKSYSGKPITDIIHVGIGGSDLGPKMIYEALREKDHSLRCHYISNHDLHAIERILNQLNPETSIALFVSKTFTTQETLANAKVIKNWFIQKTRNNNEKEAIKKQLFAVTTATDLAQEFGILPNHIFPFWEWVGGRYSVWSAVSLSSAIVIGMENFEKFLAGAHAMDRHFQSASFSENMPVILGLLGIWYNNFFGANTKAIIPYSQQLEYFPHFLQQLQMESQGKSVTRLGENIHYPTGGILWGGVGTNSQHSFHQLLFQGNQLVPIDFLLPLKVNQALKANCFAQSRTFMQGYSDEEIMKDMQEQGHSLETIKNILPHKRIRGNCPSNTFLFEDIDPYSLGALIALYEHKVYVQSVIWDINPFDQWGVERGKMLAKSVTKDLHNDTFIPSYDASTNGLLERVKRSK